MTLDEKEIKKEQRKMEREERRHKKRQEQMKKNEEQKQGKKISEDMKKKMVIAGIILLVLIVFILCRKPFMKFVNETGRDNTYENYVLLEDVTGYSEDDALEALREQGFVNIKRKYIIDQFTEDKCVIKTNFHINSYLKPDEEIVLYICDKSLLNDDKTIEESQEVNDTYFTMDNISIIDMKIKDDNLYCIIRNDSSQAIKDISYKIGYQDESGISIGENKYDLDVIILPGEKQLISCEIKNKNAKYLYISGFSYTKIDVPDNER